jgi:hypothetical protein
LRGAQRRGNLSLCLISRENLFPSRGNKMDNKHIETIVNGLEPVALIVKADFNEDGLHFFTPDSFSQQVAYMKHPAGKKVVPHVHKLIPRQVLLRRIPYDEISS